MTGGRQLGAAPRSRPSAARTESGRARAARRGAATALAALFRRPGERPEASDECRDTDVRHRQRDDTKGDADGGSQSQRGARLVEGA